MELIKLIKHLQRRKTIIIISVLVCVIGGFILARNWSATYTASLTFYVEKTPEVSAAGDYSYDGYYAQQTAEAYTDTVVGLIESPDIMAQVLDDLNIPRENQFKEYYRSLDVMKTGPQVISVKVTRPDRGEAKRLVEEIADNLSVKISELNETQQKNIILSLINTDPLVAVNRIPVVLTTFVIGLLGLMFISLGVLFEYYLKENE